MNPEFSVSKLYLEKPPVTMIIPEKYIESKNFEKIETESLPYNFFEVPESDLIKNPTYEGGKYKNKEFINLIGEKALDSVGLINSPEILPFEKKHEFINS